MVVWLHEVYLVNKMVISWWFGYIKVYLVNKIVISWWFVYMKVYLVHFYVNKSP
jgi:hypothetical protein